MVYKIIVSPEAEKEIDNAFLNIMWDFPNLEVNLSISNSQNPIRNLR